MKTITPPRTKCPTCGCEMEIAKEDIHTKQINRTRKEYGLRRFCETRSDVFYIVCPFCEDEITIYKGPRKEYIN